MSGSRPSVVILRWRRSYAPNRRTSTDPDTDATVASYCSKRRAVAARTGAERAGPRRERRQRGLVLVTPHVVPTEGNGAREDAED